MHKSELVTINGLTLLVIQHFMAGVWRGGEGSEGREEGQKRKRERGKRERKRRGGGGGGEIGSRKGRTTCGSKEKEWT